MKDGMKMSSMRQPARLCEVKESIRMSRGWMDETQKEICTIKI